MRLEFIVLRASIFAQILDFRVLFSKVHLRMNTEYAFDPWRF